MPDRRSLGQPHGGSGLRADGAPALFALGGEHLEGLIERARALDRSYEPGDLLRFATEEEVSSPRVRRLKRGVQIYGIVDGTGVGRRGGEASVSRDAGSGSAIFVERRPLGRPPQTELERNPLASRQGYLSDGPRGVGAAAAWNVPGGNGENCRLAVVEQGWNLVHNDFKGVAISQRFGRNQRFRSHGANTLGVVVARDNRRDGIGLAHGVTEVLLCSEDTGEGTAETANAILAALPDLELGDLVLVESQVQLLGSLAPIETDDLVFEVIRLATALGVTVVAPAANGGRQIDSIFSMLRGVPVFDRSRRDSGSILVAAASASVPHLRLDFSGFGSAVDCYAWGERVVTVGGDEANQSRNAYNFNFGGTSAAAAIIAGVALALQGIARRSLGGPFRPQELRAILADRRFGTASANPASDRIGVMPDLRRILESRELRRRLRDSSRARSIAVGSRREEREEDPDTEENADTEEEA